MTQAMGKAIKVCDDAIENHLAISPSSIVPTLEAIELHARFGTQSIYNMKSMLNVAIGNLVKLKSSSTHKVKFSSSEDCTSEVLIVPNLCNLLL